LQACVIRHSVYIIIIIICHFHTTPLFIILDCACDWNGIKIAEEKYIDSINKAAYNKRKARNQANRITKNKDTEEAVTPRREQHQTVKRGHEHQISKSSSTQQSQQFPKVVHQMTDVQMPSCSYTDTSDAQSMN
jgi:hypothetical protein